MRVASWNPEEFAPEILSNCMERIEKAAIVVRDAARRKVPVWKGKLHGPYKKGKYAGERWTAREYGGLLKSIRVTKKKESYMDGGFGFRVANNMNVWIMCGNFLSFYAVQVEFGRGGWKGGAQPFLRPAFNESMAQIKTIIENG